MSEPYIQQLFADRIGGKNFGKEDKIYKFEKIKRAKRAALAANPDARGRTGLDGRHAGGG